MHANLGYQPEVSTKFQLNRTANGWEIVISFQLEQQHTTPDMNLEGQVKS